MGNSLVTVVNYLSLEDRKMYVIISFFVQLSSSTLMFGMNIITFVVPSSSSCYWYFLGYPYTSCCDRRHESINTEKAIDICEIPYISSMEQKQISCLGGKYISFFLCFFQLSFFHFFAFPFEYSITINLELG